MLGARSPQLAKAAAHAPQADQDEKALAKRFYRLLNTPRFSHQQWLKLLYADARQVVEDSEVDRVIVALDPVNFEKAYAERIEGISLEFITRATSERWIEVYNERLDRWEQEKLMEIVSTFPGRLQFKTGFIHEGKLTIVRVTLDWFQMRIPGTTRDLWVIVAETGHFPDLLILITDRPVRSAAEARVIYNDWRRRPTIELYYRFVQEDGLDVERRHKIR
jgi:hypothetical protein